MTGLLTGRTGRDSPTGFTPSVSTGETGEGKLGTYRTAHPIQKKLQFADSGLQLLTTTKLQVGFAEARKHTK
jgi:hypothetical protein